ncbi:MAG TPA: hypothetical protein VIZ43_25875, partial [Trebonia sp.]
MTAAAIPGRPERAPARPVSWTRLAWVTWRQHRAALAGAGALFVVIAAYLAYMGWEVHRAYNAFNACLPASLREVPLGSQGGVQLVGPPACLPLTRAFMSFYGTGAGPVGASGINAQTVPFLLLAVPVLVGAFVGGPVLARELESGTFRFAWTQGAGRVRLAVARL